MKHVFYPIVAYEKKRVKYLKAVWKKWLIIGKVIGNFQLRILFSIFYILFLSIIGVIGTYIYDPLSMKKSSRKVTSSLAPWVHPKEDIKAARKSF